jgi:signal peptidase I
MRDDEQSALEHALPDAGGDKPQPPAGDRAPSADGPAVPDDGRVAPADGPVPPANARVAPADGHVASPGDQAVPADGRVASPGDQAVSADGLVAASGDQAGPADGRVAPADGRVAPADGPPAPADGWVAAGDGGGSPAGPDTSAAGPQPAGNDGKPPAAGQPGQGERAKDGPDGDKSDQAKAKAKAKRKQRGSFLRELPILVVIALALALIIKTYAFQAYYIPSGSMQNTLAIGDKVLVNKIVYHLRHIHRGDVVVFNGQGSWNPGPPPATPNPFDRLYHAVIGLFGAAPGQTDYIKRVIGVPGDHVACCDNFGRVTVNGVPLNEKSYLYPGNAPSAMHFSITVPPGQLWVMGDHRAVSDDSRDHEGYPGGGTIPENQVVGRAFWIVWPPGRWRVLPIPATFQQPALNSKSSQSAAARASAARAAALDSMTVPAVPASPLFPLAAGFAGAVPLTWGQRKLRGSVQRRLARRRLPLSGRR